MRGGGIEEEEGGYCSPPSLVWPRLRRFHSRRFCRALQEARAALPSPKKPKQRMFSCSPAKLYLLWRVRRRNAMSCSRSGSGQSITVDEMNIVFMHFTNNEKRNHEKLGCFNKAAMG